MAILNDVDLPDDLYQELQKLAITENSSINAQVITLLRNALSAVEIQRSEEQRRRDVPKLLEEIGRRRQSRRTEVEWPDSTALIREDRDR
jgi:antitoxin FitA